MAVFEIDDESANRVRDLAAQRREPPDRILRDAIAQYAERADAQKSFMDEADAALHAYRTDGRHLTGSEVRAWLKTWATSGQTPLPECHD